MRATSIVQRDQTGATLMLLRLRILLALGVLSASLPHAVAAESRFRPPAVPLVTCDPSFSVWSFTDRLTDDATHHWTGAKQLLTSMVRVDGKAYRLMGNRPDS